MKSYSFRLAKQVGNAGYFGQLSADVSSKRSIGIEVEYAASPESWQAGIDFGLHYAYEKRPGNAWTVGYNVRITKVGGHAVDTTQAVLSYVAAMLMFEVLTIVPTVEFQPDTGLFLFSK